MTAKRSLTVRLDPADYERITAEADRLALSRAALARVYLHAGLAANEPMAEERRRIGAAALRGLAVLREQLPSTDPVDVVQLIRQGRDDLAHRMTW